MEIRLQFYEDDFMFDHDKPKNWGYLNAERCAITTALERANRPDLFHSGDFIQERVTLVQYCCEELNELNDIVKSYYVYTGGFRGRYTKKVEPEDFTFTLNLIKQ